MKEESKKAAEEFSILDLQEKIYLKEETPAYFQDLNLETVLERLTMKWGRNLRNYFRYLPPTARDEAYRRAVYGDVKKEDVYSALMEFTNRMADVEELRREKGKVPGDMQRAVWELREIEAYCGTYAELLEALKQSELFSEGMQNFRGILQEILESAEFMQMREQVSGILKKIRELRLVITYEKDRVRVALGEAPGEYESAADGRKPVLRNPFAANPVLTELERACLEVLEKKQPEFFRGLLESAQRYEAYERPVLKRFEKEILFYLSFGTLQREMEKKGFSFAVPEVSEERPPEGKGLYDLALACVSLADGRKVIANDFYYNKGESFFVLTGPNQGGKTTFARSLGQLVYFARIGLDVPAKSANVPFFPDIQTHFSVEESVETGRGKLKEELVRLAPMMEEHCQGTFVIINELFTTAASYDAQIMGRKVLEHFIGLGCMGIYVTHLKELTAVHESVVSLRAMLDERRLQTFEIRRGEASDIACAENQVNKYRLTYEQLKERL